MPVSLGIYLTRTDVPQRRFARARLFPSSLIELFTDVCLFLSHDYTVANFGSIVVALKFNGKP